MVWQALNFVTLWAVLQILHELHYVSNFDTIYAVKNARLPGRFEFINGSPSWLLDVAHNVAAVESLVSTTSRFFSRDRIVAVMGATDPHDYRSMIRIMCSLGTRIGFVEGFYRAISATKLAVEVSTTSQLLRIFATPAEAIDYFLGAPAFAEMTVIVTGSLLLVGQWRNELAQRGLLAEKDC